MVSFHEKNSIQVLLPSLNEEWRLKPPFIENYDKIENFEPKVEGMVGAWEFFFFEITHNIFIFFIAAANNEKWVSF